MSFVSRTVGPAPYMRQEAARGLGRRQVGVGTGNG